MFTSLEGCASCKNTLILVLDIVLKKYIYKSYNLTESINHNLARFIFNKFYVFIQNHIAIK